MESLVVMHHHYLLLQEEFELHNLQNHRYYPPRDSIFGHEIKNGARPVRLRKYGYQKRKFSGIFQIGPESVENPKLS